MKILTNVLLYQNDIEKTNKTSLVTKRRVVSVFAEVYKLMAFVLGLKWFNIWLARLIKLCPHIYIVKHNWVV